MNALGRPVTPEPLPRVRVEYRGRFLFGVAIGAGFLADSGQVLNLEKYPHRFRNDQS